MSQSRSFFRYSIMDGLLAFCGVGIVALHFWTFLAFDNLSWWLLALTACAIGLTAADRVRARRQGA